MMDGGHKPVNQSSPDRGADGPAGNEEPAAQSPPERDGRPFPKTKERPFPRRDAFATAFTMGVVVTFICSMVVFSHRFDPDNLPADAFVWLTLAGFLGGVVSGFSLAAHLHRFRWRFFWLVAASPALPIWGFTLFLLVRGVKISSDLLVAICFACGGALGGAVAGEGGGRWWKQGETHSDLAFWVRFLKALLNGIGGAFVGFLYFFLPFSMTTWSSPSADWIEDLLVVGMYIVPPFAGGVVAGKMVSGVLADRRWPYLYLALVSPAIPFLVLTCIMTRGFSRIRTVHLLALPGWVALSVLGSFVWYCSALRAKRRKAQRSRGSRRKSARRGGDR